jgi:hypothetical protein
LTLRALCSNGLLLTTQAEEDACTNKQKGYTTTGSSTSDGSDVGFRFSAFLIVVAIVIVLITLA